LFLLSKQYPIYPEDHLKDNYNPTQLFVSWDNNAGFYSGKYWQAIRGNQFFSLRLVTRVSIAGYGRTEFLISEQFKTSRSPIDDPLVNLECDMG
jgi:hypothetical protein